MVLELALEGAGEAVVAGGGVMSGSLTSTSSSGLNCSHSSTAAAGLDPFVFLCTTIMSMRLKVLVGGAGREGCARRPPRPLLPPPLPPSYDSYSSSSAVGADCVVLLFPITAAIEARE